ncbi:MAG: hypothetical protein PHY93_15925 [Bacteriovorax sp.]|nr:hypothetical protein [Bacteriovorax sp.]
MIKLALVGKNIQHSRSPDIYQGILGNEVEYGLLDFADATEIPSAKELLSIYDGVSITSPYKKHFLPDIELTSCASLVGAVNCLRLRNGIITGENTDFLAVVNILENWIQEYKQLNIIILGDGVMSTVTQQALNKCRVTSFKVFSRKTSNYFDQLNIPKIFETQFPTARQRIVINTCSRDFIFKGCLDKQTIFWDFNYNFEDHLSSLPAMIQQYIDGLEMLELQAQYALAFWSIKSI